MNPEIEKLIDLAIADGQITEKERNVILKKAIELGADADEAEMILDGKLHQLEASKPKQKEKVGNIKTCPACGAAVKSLSLSCEDCGHEFTNVGVNNILNDLLKKINSVNFNSYQFEVDYYSHIASIIRSSAIPYTAEEIFQFGVKAVSEIRVHTGFWEEDSSAWKSKVEDCILKLKMIESQNPKYIQLRTELEITLKRKSKKLNQNNLKTWLIILCIIAVFVVGFYFIFKYGPNSPFKENIIQK
jgi:hypothetical protein